MVTVLKNKALQKSNSFISIFIFLIVSILIGCSSSKDIYYELPLEFRQPQKKIEFIENYRHYLKGIKIFIDPGHGGNDRKNVGFEGNVVEADINLNVALVLAEYLREANADVYLSRDKDTTITLEDRSKMADSVNADIFISIHHNAPGAADDIWTNYTSTYYHSKPGNYNFNPINNDLAKYIQRDLAYAMRNSGGPYSFDGTYSDYIIYPSDGFYVLRNSKIPAVLIESGFTTHHNESQRLIDPLFNRIEAWGIFRGLCRFLKAGIPKINFESESDTVNANINELNFSITDSLNIIPNSITVRIDSILSNDYSFNEKNNLLIIDIFKLEKDEHIIKITAANINGIHSFPFEKEIFVIKNKTIKGIK
ncbi:MAG: hypothetical protein CO128_06785 [Ignavibacteriales bacterium CG_4_9_14_3_um_filter_30_11]|nr:MAG: hypothetical protein CO128_06785 [Ignavibacteriales bacterium CG_4_9_14_3_um_filter_30_11]